MAFDLKEIQGRVKGVLPPRLLGYGPEGIGKSTFADLAPNPIFCRLEKDRGLLKSDEQFCSTYDEVMHFVAALIQQEHSWKTFCLDTVDWLEPLIFKKVCELNNWATIETPGYGKGYVEALALWRELFEALDYLSEHKGMIIILLGHAQAKAYKNPETEGYDRYNLKVNEKSSAIIREWVDAVFFINYQVTVAKEKEGFNQERKRAVGGSTRIIYTSERPAAIAKNRYNLPDKITFDRDGNYWGIIAQHIPFLTAMVNSNQPSQQTEN